MAWQQIVDFAALASIVVGALGAIGQTNIKRLLAYSSINNVGFMLIGLAAATPGRIRRCWSTWRSMSAMTIGGFVAVLMLRDADGNQVEAISDIAGLSRTRPLLALGSGGHVQPGRHPAAVRLLGQVRGVPGSGRGRAGSRWR
jgi:NADH-quinone oxidoreductase subunit N